MNRLDRLGAFFVIACMAVAIVLLLLIHWSGLFWTFWVWLWN
jgi:hypothetical protein